MQIPGAAHRSPQGAERAVGPSSCIRRRPPMLSAAVAPSSVMTARRYRVVVDDAGDGEGRRAPGPLSPSSCGGHTSAAAVHLPRARFSKKPPPSLPPFDASFSRPSRDDSVRGGRRVLSLLTPLLEGSSVAKTCVPPPLAGPGLSGRHRGCATPRRKTKKINKGL